MPTPFPQTADRLQAGEVDAAFVTEPFLIQDAQRTRRRACRSSTPRPARPRTCRPPATAATGEFAKDNPKTVAAFQQAMQRATELAPADRSKVEPLLVEFSDVDEDTAKMATLLTFQSKLDADPHPAGAGPDAGVRRDQGRAIDVRR